MVGKQISMTEESGDFHTHTRSQCKTQDCKQMSYCHVQLPDSSAIPVTQNNTICKTKLEYLKDSPGNDWRRNAINPDSLPEPKLGRISHKSGSDSTIRIDQCTRALRQQSSRNLEVCGID